VLALVDPLLEPSETSDDDRREQTGERRRRVHRRRLRAAILDARACDLSPARSAITILARALLICRNSSPDENLSVLASLSD
jgi:hypothetical protein